MTTSPDRKRILEGTAPVADRLGITTEMLRDIARESGLYIQRKAGGPLYWTAELESRLVKYIETRYVGAAPQVAGSDPFA